MPAGLIQILAVGNQDSVLVGNPEITFFKKIYMRHTKLHYSYINRQTIKEITIYEYVTENKKK